MNKGHEICDFET